MYSVIKRLGICCMAFILAGCWDQVESEERGYVIGVAIDAFDHDHLEDIEELEEDDTSSFQENNKFKATYQFVITSALQAQGSSDGQGSGKAFLNMTSVGNTMFKITRDVAKEASRSPFLEHIKVIIISEELAKKGYFPKVLDIFLRDHEMRRAAKVMISKEEAGKTFEIQSKIEKLPVLYMNSITENEYKTAEMLPATNIGDVHAFLLGTNSFTIPNIDIEENRFKVAGAAVFQGNNQKMIGSLNEEETKGLNFITGEVQGGVLELLIKGHPVAFEIKNAKRKIHANISNKNQVDFTITIEAEGNVGESFEGLDLLDPKLISTIEDEVTKEIERTAKDVIEKTQKELQVDVLGLGSYLHQEHHDSWKDLKEDWDHGENYFANSTIQVKVKVKVRNIGVNIETRK